MGKIKKKYKNKDIKDQNESRKILLLISVLFLVLIIAGAFMFPLLMEIFEIYFSPGLGLKESAVIAFFISLITMIVLAISAGDGLLGEIQFMIGGFFSFFIILWLMIAWIF